MTRIARLSGHRIRNHRHQPRAAEAVPPWPVPVESSEPLIRSRRQARRWEVGPGQEGTWPRTAGTLSWNFAVLSRSCADDRNSDTRLRWARRRISTLVRVGMPLHCILNFPPQGATSRFLDAPCDPVLSTGWSLPARATVSADGVTWRQTEPGDRVDGRVSYRLTGTGGPLWVAWGPPFTSRENDELLDHAAAMMPQHASVFELTRSLEGRAVRGLRIAVSRRSRLPAVWIQARQHAWESGSSWVARGFVEWLLGDEPEARWLREHADVTVIPVMDVDRVATGDGGKESSPHDHNRDWSLMPHYPEVVAADQRRVGERAHRYRRRGRLPRDGLEHAPQLRCRIPWRWRQVGTGRRRLSAFAPLRRAVDATIVPLVVRSFSCTSFI